MNIKNQIKSLEKSVEEFKKFILSLESDIYLKKFTDWSPRDVLAHLVGWNRYTIKGSKQIMERESPLYFDEPGEDFCKVNEVLVKKYSTTDRKKLINELDISLGELKDFLRSISENEWEKDFGVRYKGYSITIRNSVEGLIKDYIKHKKDVEDWIENLSQRSK